MKKRSVRISGHATSISLEDEFWNEIKMIAAERGLSVNDFVSEIDASRELQITENPRNLSSALRLTVLEYYKERLKEKQQS